jgi:hypothetical protein
LNVHATKTAARRYGRSSSSDSSSLERYRPARQKTSRRNESASPWAASDPGWVMAMAIPKAATSERMR